MRFNKIDGLAFLCGGGTSLSTTLMATLYAEADFTHVSKDARTQPLRNPPDIPPTLWQMEEDAHPHAKPGDQFRICRRTMEMINGAQQEMMYVTERVNYRTVYGHWNHHVYIDVIPPPAPTSPKYPVHACCK